MAKTYRLEVSKKFRTRASEQLSEAINARGRRWLLRGMLATNGWKRLTRDVPIDEDEELAELLDPPNPAVATFLGVELGDKSTQAPAHARRRLKAHYRALMQERLPPFSNSRCLMDELGLSELESDIVLFSVLIKRQRGFRTGLSWLGRAADQEDVFMSLAACLGASREAIAQAFRSDGALSASGLVWLDADSEDETIDNWISVLPGLTQQLDQPQLSAATLLSRYLRTSVEPPRALEDFTHLGQPLVVLRRLIEGALRRHTKGVNVLLYGPTGTGKTAVVHALATAVGAQLLEVSVSDDGGEALDRKARIQALRFVGRLGAQGDSALILFDEVEDYFTNGSDFLYESRGAVGPGKGFTSELLESSAVPTFWITNNLEGIDPALRRRFDLILEFGLLPRSARGRVATQYLEPLGIGDTSLVARLTAHERLAPGLIARAARAVELSETHDLTERTQAFECVLNGHLSALGLGDVPPSPRLELPYGLRYLALAVDPLALITSLRVKPEGRLLFYGLSGTGKSALARYLANELGLPFLKKRASDLLTPFVGETEQAIQAMFRGAHEQRALLVLDECDSFLRARTGARYSWEVSLVNEMLTQMEDFNGIFIATTNLLDDLDDASLRRFDLKLAFGELKPEQATALFADILEQTGRPISDLERQHWRVRLTTLNALTPGDFQAAVRGLSMLGIVLAPESLFRALHTECALKLHGRNLNPFGFTAPSAQACRSDSELVNTPPRM
jgi:SpoVK/Ycf46/Vps4 family AAA+-type ATPase